MSLLLTLGGGSGTGHAVSYRFQATTGQTTFSGNDANDVGLAYVVGNVIVLKDGIELDPADYTASNSTSVVLDTPCTGGEQILIITFGLLSPRVVPPKATAALGEAGVDDVAYMTAASTAAAIAELAPGGGGSVNASGVVVTPAGGISSTNVQAALVELDTEVAGKAASGHGHSDATGIASGFMSATDKTKLDELPAYSLRAAVNFSGVPLSGTYTRTGNLITVTMTAHGMSSGQVAVLDFTTGLGTDGTYIVNVTGPDTFTVVDAASGTTSGNVTRTIHIRSRHNVSTIVDGGVGIYTVTFDTALPDNWYTAVVSGGEASTSTRGNISASGQTTTSIRLESGVTSAHVALDLPFVSLAVFR